MELTEKELHRILTMTKDIRFNLVAVHSGEEIVSEKGKDNGRETDNQ